MKINLVTLKVFALISLFSLSRVEAGDSPESFRAAMSAVRKEYLRLSGRTGIGPNSEFEVRHLFPTRVGSVYLARAKSNGETDGPFFLIQRKGETNEVHPYKMEFPEKLLGVFADMEGASNFGVNGSRWRSVRQTISVPIVTYEDKLRLYLCLVTGSPPLGPKSIAGTLVPYNDGNQFPWWHWSLSDVELVDASSSSPPLGQIELDPTRWIARHGSWFQSNFHPIALLQENGFPFVGEFEPGKLIKDIPAIHLFQLPGNDYQRRFYSIFVPYLKNEQELEDAISRSPSRHVSGISITVDIPGVGKKILTPTDIEVGSLGRPKGSGKNPDHVLYLAFDTLEGFRVSLGFQNSLPRLMGRSIYFAKEPSFVGHVQLGFMGESDFETAMVKIRETPVKHGLFRVNRLSLSPKDRLLTGLNAEASFQSGEFFWRGKMYPGASGTIQLDLPEGSLDPRFSGWESQDIRIHRKGSKSFYGKESGSEDDLQTFTSKQCSRVLGSSKGLSL